MIKESLVTLLHELEQEMLRLGYTKGTMKFYRRRWQMLLSFARERCQFCFSEQLGIDFLEAHFHIFKKDFERTLTQSETQELRVIRMVGDFQLHRTILRRYYKHKEILTDPYFITLRDHFKQYCTEKDYSKVTVDHYVKQSARFMDYLSSQGIEDCREIMLSHVNDYIKTLAGYTYKTVEQVICSLRAFFRFLLATNKILTDIASKMPMVQARKQTRIPSVWTKEELKQLLNVIDRGSPKGKRDYSIGILTIHHSKKDNSRLVPMSTSLLKRCHHYSRIVYPFSDNDNYYFPALNGKPMTITNVYRNFRRFLWNSRISHGGRGKGPRIHDFRHTYACHCLKKWVVQEKDLTTYLPVLKAYMGHDSFEETAYYLRLTADVFPNIIVRLEGKYPKIIPLLEGVADETY